MQVAETADKESQDETLNKEAQVDKQPMALQAASSGVPVGVASLSALAIIGAAAACTLPNLYSALPNFNYFTELLPREAASAPIPDPPVSATLRDIQSAQQQNTVALQENGAVLQQNLAMLRQGAATLDSLKQTFTAQPADLKRISNQLSSLMTRVDSLQNAVTSLTTSAIAQPNARARVIRMSSKRPSRLPEPVGPVSVGGAPLGPAPSPGSGAG
jgi:ABC-type transporter Mla subunit MlaD